MSQTPFDSLLRKQRQRRTKLVHNIQNKDLKRRSASYSLKIQNDPQDPQIKKPRERQRSNFTNSAKKSSYCRKFMNKTVEGHMTSEEFNRFKDKMGRMQVQQSMARNLFKEVWEKENSRKDCEKYSESSLEIYGKGTEEKQNKNKSGPPILVFQRSTEQKCEQVEKIENITEIAQRRKNSLDFDLEVQGNKKSIRIKEISKSLPKKKTYLDTQQQYQAASGNLTPEEIIPSHQYNFARKGKKQFLKPPCTFFKQFKEKHYPQIETFEENENTLVSKIRYNLDKLQQIADPSSWAIQRTNTGDFRTLNTPCRLRREIKSSWNTTYDQTNRINKIGTADIGRLPTRRIKKPIRPTFVNDIIGWNVAKDGEDDQGMLFNQ